MAYVSQELKAKLAPKIKEICKKYGVKASLAVRNHSTLVLNVKSGQIDFVDNFNQTVNPRVLVTNNFQVNPYWYHEQFTGRALDFLSEVIPAMKGPDYFDHSDLQSDYFHCSHYFDVNIGQWNKPFQLTSSKG